MHERCKVLVIDDNRDCADSAVMLLRSWGHEAVAAYSPEEAVLMGRRFDPDVVVVDIGLPRKNGFDVAAELQECCPEARFIALTGFTQGDIVSRSRNNGFRAHLTKPANPSEFNSVVKGACDAAARSAKR